MLPGFWSISIDYKYWDLVEETLKNKSKVSKSEMNWRYILCHLEIIKSLGDDMMKNSLNEHLDIFFTNRINSQGGENSG